MVKTSTRKTNKEVSPVRRILVLAVIAAAILALTAAPALAEGYNDPLEYTRATGSASGPHGGYTSTTNKCQDCHSTHYASGSYVLLRANSREAACDYCHVGGGGSSVNIQMDNDYNGAAEATTSRGYGTGHTLGYQGNAPVDINPAFSDSQGFACFDCHTPHGNSARVLTTFANPGRAFEPTTLVTDVYGKFATSPIADPTTVGATDNGDGRWDISTVTINNGDAYWGLTQTEGNIVLVKDVDGTAGVTKKVMKKPIWPTGRFLLLKNPDNAEGGVADTVVATGSATADNGVNKLAIDWDEPLGPADKGYGGDQNNDYDKAMPWNPAGVTGLSAVNEFCQDCHDGAAGASTQPANVWYPDAAANNATGAYTVAYSHDAQPRH
jgi:hypothetical protein